ncbi:glycerophosphocholine phosphodiesterase [Saccharomycopsis crataegensis]|uniref:Glycerophosphocholine phosphodiesterase n=1 Tax=Saccharomycopsis crataegensis TaxID=43959 RepID=A0AAV5QHR8_9ASCO|nr:glycerophosphocholine phosphodiesterase [Saccharomycopsis crataegensis]
MKFGKTFLIHQVPEWSGYYMNYKELKREIKAIVVAIDDFHSTVDATNDFVVKDGAVLSASAAGAEIASTLNDETVKSSLAGFFTKLDRNIEKVESFYNFQFSEYERRLKRVTTAMHSHKKDGKMEFDKEELEEVIGILVELRGNFRNLKWFSELNKRGFIKILKKLDKKAGTNKQMYYLSSHIFPLSFASETEILRELNLINKYLSELSPQADELVALTTTTTTTGIDSSSGQSTANGGYVSPNSGKYMCYIRKDDSEGLIKELANEFRSPILTPSKLLLNLLNKSALFQAFGCIDKLMEFTQVLNDSSDISARNFFHHHIIALGKQTVEREQKEAEKEKPTTEASAATVANTYGLLIERDMSLLPAAAPDKNFRLVGAYGSDGVNSNDSPSGLEYILSRLPTSSRHCLLQRDSYKRAPLHYAAQYGLKETSAIIIDFLKKWSHWDSSVAIDDITVWGDAEYLTPLHLALVGDHPKTTKILLSSMDGDVSLSNPGLLLLAARLKSSRLLESLLEVKGMDINYNKTDTMETALFISAKLNSLDSVKFLLQKGADCEIPEASFGWTPIFAAAAEGYAEVTKALIDHGANYSRLDNDGWLAMEHCSLRGHLDLAELLCPKDYDPLKLAKESNLNNLLKKDGGSSTLNSNGLPPKIPDLVQESTNSVDKLPASVNVGPAGTDKHIYKEIKSNKKESNNRDPISSLNNGNSSVPTSKKPVKSFGHQFLKPNESMVLLTLGTTDLRDKTPAIQLNRVPVSKAHSTELDTALSVAISCKQLKNQPPVVLDLPLDDNHGSATDPISFKFVNQDPRNAAIYFDIFPTYSYAGEEALSGSTINSINDVNVSKVISQKKRKVLGRAIALLGNVYTSVGKDRRSMYNVCTVPIIESVTLEELGTVRFEILDVSSFTHPNMTYDISESYWKTLISTRVIGHRGLGKNINSKSSLQLGENTVESFIAAASLGASYVEFDVQLTKDLVPVIYHDFLVAESGMDIPMHQMTAEQFLKLSDHRPDQDFNLNSGKFPRNKHASDNRISYDDDALLSKRKFRSASLSMNNKKAQKFTIGNDNDDDDDSDDEEKLGSVFDERMKLTRTYKEQGFKGNSRGTSIASSFVTLEDLFKKLPENVGFNVECKYPMLEEAQKEDFEEIAISYNKWVDVVLQKVYDHKGQRNIIFSSFHPDVCILLSMKQPAIPILFLTEAGSQFMPDARASSLQAAIRFAKKWNLLGIVSAAAAIIQCPRLASIVKSNGLVCFTYGALNNDPENAKLEMEAGVDAVIVDKVLAVRKGLANA